MAETKYQLLVNSLTDDVNLLLKDYDLSIEDKKILADCVKKTSDFYIQNPSSPTPWERKEVQIANIAYYYPLNTLRAFHCLSKNVETLNFSNCLDIGSGLGAFSKALKFFLPEVEVYNLEISPVARGLHQKISNKEMYWLKSEKEASNFDLISFSYSYTENISVDHLLAKTKKLWLLEPSTKEDFSKLEELRASLISNGASILAPCPHQEKCPMKEGKKDWCHFSFLVDLPEYLMRIESLLPWQHRALSYSYLYASLKEDVKPSLDGGNFVRLLARPQKEKGKTRQAICRNEEREFLSVLKKDPLKWPGESGDLLSLEPGSWEKKGNEIRLKKKI